MKKNYLILCLAALFAVSCNYLDVVPDNIATLEGFERTSYYELDES